MMMNTGPKTKNVLIMKKRQLRAGVVHAITLFIGITFLPSLLVAQDKGVYKDVRDGNEYNWSKIGAQTWMSENLRFLVLGASRAYNDDSAFLMKYGMLYTWKAAQAACPKGWHLPSDKDWNALIQNLGGISIAGQKLQSMDTVGKHNTGGAQAQGAVSSFLGGVRHPDGSCIGITYWGGCWTSGKINDSIGSNILFARGAREVSPSTNDKAAGFSVRCMKSK
jgi:uncharacterized protein (TIGR02145 family)